jgi:hypothetical protein
MTVKSAGGRDQGSGSRGQVLRLAPHYYFSGGRPPGQLPVPADAPSWGAYVPALMIQ